MLGYNVRVSFILGIIGVMVLLDAVWWIVSVRLAKARAWKFVTSVFVGIQLAGFLWLIAGRMSGSGLDRWLPKFASSAIFIWHFFGLALLLLIGVGLIPICVVRKITRFFQTRRGRTVENASDAAALSRREFIGIAAVVAPSLFTIGLTSVAMAQLASFRVRKFVLRIPDLPRDLDGMTIAQVSDIHVGRFTSGRVLREMVATTNDLRADLVLLTGDLINDALADLSEGLDLVRAMQGRFGLWMIEGNHDLIENGAEFERRVKASGVPLLLDESQIVPVRNHPVQLLGLRWNRAYPQHRDEVITGSVRQLLKQRHGEVFPILMAHHPHAFDAAAEAGVPLVLSGHTHGGQLMLNEREGFGPAMFRYWSGLYTRGRNQMIVSNGVGNWFPLRVNAPAEIVHITLRRP